MSDHSVSNKSMTDNSMSHKSMSAAVSTMEGVGGVMHGGHRSSEGLGLGGGPVLSLEGLGDRLVGDLSGNTSNKAVSTDETMSTNKAMSTDKTVSSDKAMSTDKTVSSDKAVSTNKAVSDQAMSDSSAMVDRRHSVSHNRGGVVGGGSEGSDAIVAHLSNIAGIWVGVVADKLGAAVREVDGVGALSVSGPIAGLGGVEV